MKKKIAEVQTTWKCIKCEEEKPLTPEFFRRSHVYKNGFMSACKKCTALEISNKYLHYTKDDVEERGYPVGIRCPLWSERCGVCPCPSLGDLSACWRLKNVDPSSKKYPTPLEQ